MSESSSSGAHSSKPPKRIYCEVCEAYLSSASLLQVHNKGKKHQGLIKLKDDRDKSTRRSVYVQGFDCSGTIEDELSQLFSNYGKVNNIYVDKDKGLFAIIEFETEECATEIFNQQDTLIFRGKELKVKKRNQPKPKEKIEKEQSDQHPAHNPYSQKRKKHSGFSIAEFIPEELVSGLTSSRTVSQQICLLTSHLKLKEDGLQLRTLICQLLGEVFQEFYPSSKVVPFGSSVNGLGCQECDLDICLLVNTKKQEATVNTNSHGDCTQESNECSSKSNDSSKDHHLVLKVLRTLVPGCSNVVPVFSAKCPVIKFSHQPSGVSCDLTINNRLGIQNTNLLQCYINLDPRVQQLVFTVRAWAKATGVSRVGGGQLTNYAVTLMTLYFLQTTSPPVIPSLQNIIGWPLVSEPGNTCGCESVKVEGKEEWNVIDGWDCNYFRDVERLLSSSNTKPIEQLLEDFFDFYGNKFDFGNCAVNIRTGKHCTILAVQKELEAKWKGGMLFDLKPTNPEFKVTPLSVQDPFELSHNVAQNVGVTALKNIIQQMMDACKICKTFTASEVLADSDKNKGIMKLLYESTRSCSKRRKVDSHSFDVPLSPDKVLETQHSTCVQSTCLTVSSARSVFENICTFLQDDLQMQCDVAATSENLQLTKQENTCSSQDCSSTDIGECEKKGVCNVDGTPMIQGLEGCTSNLPSTKLETSDEVEETASPIAQIPSPTCELPKQILPGNWEDSFTAVCTAWENTWTHCRRERRKNLMTTESSNKYGHTSVKGQKDDSVSLTEVCATSRSDFQYAPEMKSYEEKSRLPSEQKLNMSAVEHEGLFHLHNHGKFPALVFKLVCGGSHADHQTHPACSITILHLSSRGFHTFSTFFAFFKKEVMTMCSAT